MKGRSAGDLFGKDGVLAELTRALAERALGAELDDHLTESARNRQRKGRSLQSFPETNIIRNQKPDPVLRQRTLHGQVLEAIRMPAK
tara:strand:+ start:192 stop:452 length:261 start_codon:yes stop_codon:yes gene_type:complete